MDVTPRSRPSFPRAPILLLILAVTTGWAEAPGSNRPHDTSAAGWITSGPSSFVDRSTDAPAPVLGFAINRQDRSPEFPAPKTDAGKPASNEKPSKPPKTEKPAKVTKPARADSPPTYAGQNRFWIPSLGISNRVHLFACSRQRPPDDYMYRWGCAGKNNVYIMGHASSVMKPLHDAYVRGRLKVGMLAIYANGNGVVTRYRVTEWRVVDPVDSHWAIADQPVPSMTLQTCVGKDGRLRLNVRLVAVD